MKCYQLIREVASVALIPYYPYYWRGKELHAKKMEKTEDITLERFLISVNYSLMKLNEKYPGKYWLKINYKSKGITHFV